MTIYYVRRQDGLVKIGTTRDLRSRIRHLQYDHGPLELLATEPGSFTEEFALHRRYAKLRVEGEWFREVRALRLRIRRLQERTS